MKNALIDPQHPVSHITSWTNPPPPALPEPVFEAYPNSARVAEVAVQEFPIAPPLFWTPCADDVVADQWYYDTVTTQILPVQNAPYPEQPQPVVSGAQTL